ncbi:MAG: hypothetical protein GX911_00795 [Spirochaetales bacterium]|nr:hypothetical protein [Spirochaetales bacterium]
MKRIRLKEFTFLVPPARVSRNWRSFALTTHPVAELPNAPILCAVSGEPFSFEMRLSSPPGGYVGLCAYHLDTVFASVGANTNSIRAFSMIRGYPSTTIHPFSTDRDTLIWRMRWDRKRTLIGFQREEDDPVSWVGTFELPGTASSISFGPFFASDGQAYRATGEDLRFIPSE